MRQASFPYLLVLGHRPGILGDRLLLPRHHLAARSAGNPDLHGARKPIGPSVIGDESQVNLLLPHARRPLNGLVKWFLGKRLGRCYAFVLQQYNSPKYVGAKLRRKPLARILACWKHDIENRSSVLLVHLLQAIQQGSTLHSNSSIILTHKGISRHKVRGHVQLQADGASGLPLPTNGEILARFWLPGSGLAIQRNRGLARPARNPQIQSERCGLSRADFQANVAVPGVLRLLDELEPCAVLQVPIERGRVVEIDIYAGGAGRVKIARHRSESSLEVRGAARSIVPGLTNVFLASGLQRIAITIERPGK